MAKPTVENGLEPERRFVVSDEYFAGFFRNSAAARAYARRLRASGKNPIVRQRDGASYVRKPVFPEAGTKDEGQGLPFVNATKEPMRAFIDERTSKK